LLGEKGIGVLEYWSIEKVIVPKKWRIRKSLVILASKRKRIRKRKAGRQAGRHPTIGLEPLN